MYGLFDDPSALDRDRLTRELSRLAAEGIYIGGSSWKYEGWLDQVYTRALYLSHGRFSKKLFEAECLREYACTFPAVCGDFAFYQFPTEEFWKRLFARVPAGFQFAFKVPEQITCRTFPSIPRYGAQGGALNESFLNVDLLRESFLRPLAPHRAKTAALIFEFGTLPEKVMTGLPEFLDHLDPFLAALPQEFRWAVEVRNREFLEPDYFACLRRHRVAHVYNSWTRMPELATQVAIPDSITADMLVCRALLRPGRSYEQAVRLLSPYSEVRDPNPGVRAALRDLIGIARREKKMALLFVNNRLEGNAPGTILSIMDDLT